MVLITGGSGGVGAQLARNFAKLNSRVVIWDINKDGKAIHLSRAQVTMSSALFFAVFSVSKKVRLPFTLSFARCSPHCPILSTQCSLPTINYEIMITIEYAFPCAR